MKLMVTAFLVFLHRETDGSQRPMDLMADLTNDLGVCILQVQSTLQYGNVAFSPYGLASMSILLFEGATGNTALEIMRVMKLPWNTLLVRVGFRDINRHLKTYFKSDGFLRGLIMSRDNVCFHPSYQKMLRLYGFDEPDTALTYPCTGFVPYSPPPTSIPPTTTESVNVTDNATKSTTDEIVTELTQTSQTVTVRNNSTNLQNIEASTPGLGQLETQTQTEPISTLETESAVATITLDSRAPAEELTTTSTEISGAFSYTVAAPAPESKESELSPLEAAESNIDRTTTSKTKSSTITTTSSKPVRTLTTTPLPSNNTTSLLPQLANVTSKANKNASEDEFYFSTTLDPNKFFDPNITLAFTDFTFPPTDTSATTLEPFFSNQTVGTIFPETSTLFSVTGGLNFSALDRLNFTLPTIPPLFNDFSVTELDSTSLTSFTSPFSSFEESDLHNSTFYNTLVNFIDSTTQTIKDMVGSTENPTSEATTTPSSAPKNLNSSISQNTTAANVSSTQNTTNSKAAFRSSQLKFDNANRNSGESVDPRVLPKKSISESNENLSAAINRPIAAETVQSTFRTPPNYVNVLSVKQSKTISSKYDIRTKGARGRLVRSVPLPFNYGYNNTAEIIGNLTKTLKKLQGSLKNVTQDILQPGSNFSSYSVSLKGQSAGQVTAAGPKPAYADINDFNGDVRNVRSYGHDSFHSSNVDWFATPDQNIIRVPIFSYSAMLPFAYIEDIKSKVLEVPLDDNNYSLLLILPTPQSGVDQLLNTLTRWSLRRVWNHLRPTPVYASIPKFSIISHVNLRHALYSMGIRDVFHRYRADLSLMSPDSKLFVRNIEQVVTIYVDKFPSSVYPVPEKYTEQHFVASHPFLYFVLDRDSGVSLVAGILSNPTKHVI